MPIYAGFTNESTAFSSKSQKGNTPFVRRGIPLLETGKKGAI
jgi:hypothetical protein